MYGVEIYYRVRRPQFIDGVCIHELSRVFGIHRDTVRKMLSHCGAGLPTRATARAPETQPLYQDH